jgi:hypothetical protein
VGEFSMIVYVQGDLFQSPAKVLINPVNTVGVMGKGVAAEFKRFYPGLFETYVRLCKEKRFEVGQLHLYRTPHKWVLNFPIHGHWREPVRVETLEAGLQKFVAVYAEQGITSVSLPVPPGLNWNSEARPLMEAYLDPLPVLIYVHHLDEASTARNTRSIAAWLNSVPHEVSFDKLWRDVLRLLKRKTDYQTEDGTAFTVRQDEKARSRSLVFHVEGEHIFLSESLLSDLWAYVRGAGYCLPGNLPAGLELYAPYLVGLFSHLDYVSPVQLSTNDKIWQTGLHYIPPPQKEAARTVTLRAAL